MKKIIIANKSEEEILKPLGFNYVTYVSITASADCTIILDYDNNDEISQEAETYELKANQQLEVKTNGFSGGTKGAYNTIYFQGEIGTKIDLMVNKLNQKESGFKVTNPEYNIIDGNDVSEIESVVDTKIDGMNLISQSYVGDKTALTTNNKADLVQAINEVNSKPTGTDEVKVNKLIDDKITPVNNTLTEIGDSLLSFESSLDDIQNEVYTNIVKIVDNSKYNIYSDGTNASITTTGFNNAFNDCKNLENVTIKFKHGTYLVSKSSNILIKNLKNVTIDLSSSTFIKESNNLPTYAVIKVENCVNVKILNANIIGDRDTHDFSSGGTQEWGSGLEILGWCENVHIENINCSKCTGDGIALSSNLYNHYNWINYYDLESGKIGIDGINSEDSAFSRFNKFFNIPSLSESNKYISVMGDGYGAYKGGLVLDNKNFTFIFYDITENVVYTTTIKPYDAIWLKNLPSTAVKFKVCFDVSYSNILNEDMLFTIRGSSFVNNLSIYKCDIDNNRRLGISVCGARNLTINKNVITNTNGADPQFGIDIEDGYNLNQNVTIFDNTITGNKKGGVVAVSAKGVICHSNKIDGAISLGGRRGYKYKAYNNIGENTIYIKENFAGIVKPNIVEDFVSTSQIIIDSSTTYKNSTFTKGVILNTTGELSFDVVFDNCKFDISSIALAFIIRSGNVKFINCEFILNNVNIFFKDEISTTIERFQMFDCNFILNKTKLGSISNVKNIIIKGTKINEDSPTQYESKFGHNTNTEYIEVENCTWNIVSYTLIAKEVKFINNNFIRNALNTTQIFGPNRYYGIGISASKLLTFKNNTISITNASSFPHNQDFINLKSDGLINYNENVLNLDSASSLAIKFSQLSSNATVFGSNNIYFYNINTISTQNTTFLNSEYYILLNK